MYKLVDSTKCGLQTIVFKGGGGLKIMGLLLSRHLHGEKNALHQSAVCILN